MVFGATATEGKVPWIRLNPLRPMEGLWRHPGSIADV